MKKRLFTCLTFLAVMFSFAQDLSPYKYAIIPLEYEFQRSEDQYQINSLVHFLAEKKGFEAFYEKEQIPVDLATDVCLGLKFYIERDKGVFLTKTKLVVKDCQQKVVYTSPLASTKEKDIKKAYHYTIRENFKAFDRVPYSFKPRPPKKDIVMAKEETVVIPERPKVMEAKVVDTKEAVEEGPSYDLYAQATPHGYQLVDNTPKVVYKLLSTSLSNVFMVEGENALVLKKGDDWVIERVEDGQLVNRPLRVKF